MQFNPAPALGGTNNRLDVSNAYNQVEIVATCRESTNSWPYSVAAMRPANNSINNRVTFVTGTGGLFVSASAIATGTHSSTVNERYSGVGIDSIAAASGLISGSSGTANHVTVNLAEFNGMIGLGSHFVQWLESGNGTITATWYGDNGTPLLIQSGLKVKRTM